LLVDPVHPATSAEPASKLGLEVITSGSSSTEPAAPKKRGRPAGAKNKPKAKAEPAPPAPPAPAAAAPTKSKTKKKAVVVESESEEEAAAPVTPPPSPSTHRRNQWVAYRQRQVDQYQARQAHYTNVIDKMLGF
jgi:hypothetical protein